MYIYCISGFGADHRIFKYLDFGNNEVIHIPWIQPLSEESIAGYASRLAKAIRQPDPLLIGVSFGGMMSIEISKIISVKKVILISSIKTRNEMPISFKIAANLRLNKIIPLKPYKFLEPFENYNLGISNKEEKDLAEDFRKNLNQKYSDWSIQTIINWQNKYIPGQTIHIHGSKDRIFPLKYVSPDYVIEGGGHMMIMDKAAEINKILKSEI